MLYKDMLAHLLIKLPAQDLTGQFDLERRRVGSKSHSGATRWVTTAAVIAALGTPAGAADLLPPLPPRYQPHRPLNHLPGVSSGHLPRASTALPSGERADSAIFGWGANSTSMATSVAVPTDPSGTIGGTRFDPEYQFSPNWLSGPAGAR